MTNKQILKGNHFADCSIDELHTLWNGLKVTYKNGWFEENNPLTPYKDIYCNESSIGVVRVEQDLLRAIAIKIFEGNKE